MRAYGVCEKSKSHIRIVITIISVIEIVSFLLIHQGEILNLTSKLKSTALIFLICL